MSRGLGSVQRAILDTLADEKSLDTGDLTALVFSIEPSDDGVSYIRPAQRAAVARALSGLRKQGLVDQLFRGHNKRAYWANAENAKGYRERMAGWAALLRL